MACGVAAGIRCNVTLSTQRRTDQRNRSLIDRGGATAFAEFLLPRWRSADTQCNAVRQLRRNLASGSERNVEKEEPVGALGERPHRLAQAGGLQTSGYGGCIESLQDGPISDHLDLLYSDLPTGEVRHSQLVDQVYLPVRSHKGHGCVLHCEQQRRHIL